MPTTRLRAVVALAFAAGVASLSACGGDSGGGPTFSDSISTADAQDMADGAGSVAGSIMSLNDFSVPSFAAMPTAIRQFGAAHGYMSAATRTGGFRFAPSLSASPSFQSAAQLSSAEGCTITSHGFYDLNFSNPVDQNGNGIPDDALVHAVCVQTDSISNPDTTYTQSTDIELSIKEHAGDLFGYDLKIAEQQREGDNFGNYGLESILEQVGVSINAGLATNNATVQQIEESKFDTAFAHAELGETWNSSFDPSGTITLGDPLPDGSLTFTGRLWQVDPSSTNVSFSLSTPTPLTYSSACGSNPPFTAGVLRGLLNNNSSQASFTVTYTGCGTHTVATDGTTP